MSGTQRRRRIIGLRAAGCRYGLAPARLGLGPVAQRAAEHNGRTVGARGTVATVFAARIVRWMRVFPLLCLGGVAGIGAEVSVNDRYRHAGSRAASVGVSGKRNPLVAPLPVASRSRFGYPVESRYCFGYQDENRNIGYRSRVSEFHGRDVHEWVAFQV